MLGDTVDPLGRDHFRRFISVGHDRELRVSHEDCSFFVSLCRKLENDQIASFIVLSLLDVTAVTNDTAFGLPELRRAFCSCKSSSAFLSTSSVSESSQTLAVNSTSLHRTSSGYLNRCSAIFDFETLREALSRECLTIESEDWLYGLIAGYIERDAVCASLLVRAV